MLLAILSFVSCGNQEQKTPSAGTSQKEATGDAKIRGTIKNAPKSTVELKNRTNQSVPNISDTLGANGGFEFTVKPDSITGYSIVFADEKPPVSRSPVNPDPQPDTTVTEISVVLDKGSDVEISFDANDPFNTLQASGKGAEMCLYAAKKALIGTVMSKQLSFRLRQSPEEYLRLIERFKADMENLIQTSLTDNSNFPTGFREKETLGLKYYFYRLKVNLAFNDLKNVSEAKYANNEEYLSFMKDVPFDDPGAFANPLYRGLISLYADFLVRRDNPGKVFTVDERLASKYQAYKKLYTAPATRELALYDFLKHYGKMGNQQWHMDAVADFVSFAQSDSLKSEAKKLKDTAARAPDGNAPGAKRPGESEDEN